MAQEDQPRVLSASVADFKYFAALLRGVNFANRASVSITSEGITVSVEEAKCLTATAFIFRQVFDEFEHQPDAARASSQQDPATPPASFDEDEDGSANRETTSFEIPLDTLMSCLNVFGSAGLASGSTVKKPAAQAVDLDGGGAGGGGGSGGGRRDKGKGRADADPAAGNARLDQWFAPEKGTGMRLSYGGPGHPLTLFVVDEAGGPEAMCEITTWDPEPRMELAFDSDAAVLRIILKSSWLRDALSELDSSTQTLTIIGNPPPPGNRAPRGTAPPRLRLRAVGQFGSTEMDYPSDWEVLETCECPVPVSFTYRFSHVARTMRALQSSVKTSLRIDDEGLLSLQFMMSTLRRGGENGTAAFIEFWCLPQADD